MHCCLGDIWKSAGDRSTAESAGPRFDRAQSRWRSALFIGTRLAILILASFLTMTYLFQDRLIFPGSATQGSPEAFVQPRSGAELLQLETPQKERVTALYGPALLAD